MYTLLSHSQKRFYTVFYAPPNAGNSISSIPDIETGTYGKIRTLTRGVAQKIREKLGRKMIEENIQYTQALSDEQSPQEYRNVIRKHTVVSIGDLHGSYDALIGNLRHLGLIDIDDNWIGGTTRVVFHGDIFADRYQDSLKIANYITNLGEKVRNQGGEISVLAGNHEDIAFAFLSKQPFSYGGEWVRMKFGALESSNQGLVELMIYADCRNQENHRDDMLTTLQKDPYSKNALEFMCNMKLVDQIDDTLFVHVVPHPELLRLVVQIGTDGINHLYQKGMRAYLLGTGELTANEKREFHNLRRIFLDTQHRKMTEDPIYIGIKKMGINLIINGHDLKNAGDIDIIHGVECTGVDFGYMKGKNEVTPSTLEIHTNGTMKYGDGDIYRSDK